MYYKYYLDIATPGKVYNGFGYTALQKHSMHKMTCVNSISQMLIMSDMKLKSANDMLNIIVDNTFRTELEFFL